MRNLKKILAMALALVMSLSLMATAGAAETTAATGTSSYQTATDVLKGVKVIWGDEGGDRLQDTITRAEVAALLYRISTGDVTDSQKDLYTNHAFTDVNGIEWARGYISYCYNAEIIKGNPDGTFEPDENITGYATLAMILRAMGYGKNGEFVGDGWEIQTAATGERIGVLKNINQAQLGQPATREMVAEILFRAILTETVNFSALTPYNYVGTGETLGYKQFGLEKVSGVVMANEWASLTDDEVTKSGVTEMLIDGKTVTIDKETELDAVGLTYDAYISNGEGDVKKTLTLEEGENVVAFNVGKATGTVETKNREWASIAALASTEGLKTDDNTEYFVDYDQAWNEDCTSDYLIRYAIAKSSIPSSADDAWNKYIAALNADTSKTEANKTYAGHTIISRTIAFNTNINAEGKPVTENLDCWVISIRPDALINEIDQDIMEEIFYTADRIGDNYWNSETVVGALRDYAIGEVYVGTTSMKDYSDTMSWKEFKAEYFKDTLTSRRFTSAENGESLRIVDNDKDGVAEYVLKIQYTQDKVVGAHKDAPLLNSLRVADYSGNNLYDPDEITQGDIVNYTIIDKKLSIWKADVLTDVVKTKNFSKITVTTEGGEEKGQSGITNETQLDENIMLMDEKVGYNMYLDEFGFIRSYELAQGSQYALLTELYPTGNQNYNYVKSFQGIVEMKIGDADVEEYNIANSDGSVFFSDYVWTVGTRGYWNSKLYNYLQPAMAHLDNPDRAFVNYWPGKTNNTETYKVPNWNRIVTGIDDHDTLSGYYGVFDYDAVSYTVDQSMATPTPSAGTAPATFSFTNVASYALGEDNVTLKSAAQLSYDKDGEQIYRVGTAAATAANAADLAAGKVGSKTDLIAAYAKAKGVTTSQATTEWWDVFFKYTNGTGIYPVYKVDYVQLQKEDIRANKVHYSVDGSYDSLYNTWSNTYVNATVDTEFYIVMPNSIQYKVGFSELPTIAADKVRAAYAVATNTSANASGRDYWVADVIVIEVDALEYSYDSVSLMYYNPRETTGSVRYVNSLNNQWRTLQPDSDEKAKITVIPDSSDFTGAYTGWGNKSWASNAYGFYTLYNTELQDDGDLLAADAQMITEKWNSYGIYAGTVRRTERLVTSGYIDIDRLGRADLATDDADVLPYFIGDAPIYRITSTSASDITLTPVNKYSDVKRGDEVIIVYDKAKSTVAYVVDLGARTNSYTAPEWLLSTADFNGSGMCGVNTVKTYGGTNDAKSLYCKILWEQQNGQGTTTTIGDYTVTVKASYTDAQGVAQTKVLSTTGVAKNGQLTVNGIAGLTVDGYTNDVATSNLTINNQPGTWAGGSTVTVTDEFTAVVNNGTGGFAGAVYITGINTNIEIVVPFTINSNDISANASAVGYGVSSVTTKYVDGSGNPVPAGPAAAAGTPATTGQTSIPYGTKITITVGLTTALATGQTVVPSVVKSGAPATTVPTTFAGVDADGKYLYTFTMPDYNVLVSARVALPEYTVTVTPNEGITSTNAPAKTDWTADLVVTATPKDGYDVTGATVTDSNGNTVDSSFTSNAVTIDDTDGAGKNVTITFTTEKKPPVTTVTVVVDDGYTPDNVAGGTKEDHDLLGEWPDLSNGGTIDLNGANLVTIFVEDSRGKPVVKVDGEAVNGNATSTTDEYGYIIRNLTGGEEITISAPLAGRQNPTISDIGAIGNNSGTNVGYTLVSEDPSDVLAEMSIDNTVAELNTALSASPYGGAALSGSAPNLAKADAGKFLVFVDASAAVTTTSGTLVKVGCVEVPDFDAAADKSDTVSIALDTGVVDMTGKEASGTTLTYLVVETADKTTVQSKIAAWSVATDETTVRNDINSGSNLDAITDKLIDADSDKFLVVVEIDNTTHKLVAYGTADIGTVVNTTP